ncbi:MAG TPA: tetratricopeptide repeat protein [Casimicrobiaceae bacterium]|nr:tetratricopeptide repeat protein [Casimicrobiaceae bacterium]
MNGRVARPALRTVLLATLVTGIASADAPLDVVALDRWWDFEQPAASETKFRAELAKLSPDSGARLELMTQMARAQALRRQFDEAHATLDQVEASLAGHAPRVSVRYLLERGRVFNSSRQPERAVPLFHAALDQARAAGEDFLAIDAAHMLGIAAPPAERLDWNLEAVAMTERTSDARSKRWLASLYNNIGWTYHERGEYKQALAYFEKALPAWEARGDASATRAARWSVARALRSLGRYDEALAIQRALLADLEASGDTDGFVFEELGELALAQGDAAAARPWFAKGYAALSSDPSFAADNPARLERLHRLGAAP